LRQKQHIGQSPYDAIVSILKTLQQFKIIKYFTSTSNGWFLDALQQ